MPLSPPFFDLPVDEHLEVPVILDRADIVGLIERGSVEGEHAVDGVPVLIHAAIRPVLPLGPFGGGQSRPRAGIEDETFPTGEILAVEQGDPTAGRHVEPCRDRLIFRREKRTGGGKQPSRTKKSDRRSPGKRSPGQVHTHGCLRKVG